jgi:hypothetical protein
VTGTALKISVITTAQKIEETDTTHRKIDVRQGIGTTRTATPLSEMSLDALETGEKEVNPAVVEREVTAETETEKGDGGLPQILEDKGGMMVEAEVVGMDITTIGGTKPTWTLETIVTGVKMMVRSGSPFLNGGNGYGKKAL